jgi:hypothetical protein
MRHPNTRSVLVSTVALFLLISTVAHAGRTRPPAGGGTGGGHKAGSGGVTAGKGRIIAILADGTLREMCTAYTQVTESPFTTEAGKGESSIDAASGSWAQLDTLRSQGLEAGGIGYTRGLRGRWEVGVSLATWSGLGLTTGPVSGKTSPAGFGGGSLSARHTFFGVDSAGVAMGLAASLHVPGSASAPGTTDYEGTLSLPLSASLPLDFTLGAMAQVGSIADAQTTGRHLRSIVSLQLERELEPHLSGWVEGVGIRNREPGHPSMATVNGGLTADLWGHVSLSAGAAIGRSRANTDHGFFGGVGLSL